LILTKSLCWHQNLADMCGR